MKKYFIDIEWKNEVSPIIHLKDYNTYIDEYIELPKKIFIEKINKKICVGTINPYTREYVNCNNIVDNPNEKQCSKCKYMYDFYKCVKCHGNECYVKNKDVLNYCNTPHFVYLAYFNGDKIKVGTASEIKKDERLLEQGAIFSIFIAKTPTGRLARIIENIIIEHGVSGLVMTSYKMKNLFSNEQHESLIIEKLINKYNTIIEYIPNELKKYMINPTINSFNHIQSKIDDALLVKNEELDLFGFNISKLRKYSIKKEYDLFSGDVLFVVGKILALDNNGEVELIDLKKLEGYLLNIK